MRRPITPPASVVVKVGSSSLAHPSGGVDDVAVDRIVHQILGLHRGGHQPVLVSSGAVAAGLPALGLTSRPKELADLQVAAAVGQGRLMERYANRFAEHGVVIGQVLLTRDILAHRSQYLHARQAMGRMLSLGVVPVVNENDTVVVDELKLGDNDRLAALVSHLVGASMMVLLTDTPGLFSSDPRINEHAELLAAVQDTDQILDELYRRTGAVGLGSGGVATKVAAARMAAWSGIPTVVADAKDHEAVAKAVAGAEVGTWIAPREARLSSRKLWIAFGLPSTGRIVIDDGAVSALVSANRSLLPAGVVEAFGAFESGDAVEITDTAGDVVGKGLAAVSSTTLQAAAGTHSSTAGGVAVHRDDLVILR